MKVVGEWTHARRDLEAALDRLFELPPDAAVEYDSLLDPRELDSLGYMRNFPHLTCLLCAVDENDLEAFSRDGRRLGDGYAPSATRLGLLPATCYKVYLEREGRELPAPEIVG